MKGEKYKKNELERITYGPEKVICQMCTDLYKNYTDLKYKFSPGEFLKTGAMQGGGAISATPPLTLFIRHPALL